MRLSEKNMNSKVLLFDNPRRMHWFLILPDIRQNLQYHSMGRSSKKDGAQLKKGWVVAQKRDMVVSTGSSKKAMGSSSKRMARSSKRDGQQLKNGWAVVQKWMGSSSAIEQQIQPWWILSNFDILNMKYESLKRRMNPPCHWAKNKHKNEPDPSPHILLGVKSTYKNQIDTNGRTLYNKQEKIDPFILLPTEAQGLLTLFVQYRYRYPIAV